MRRAIDMRKVFQILFVYLIALLAAAACGNLVPKKASSDATVGSSEHGAPTKTIDQN